MNAPLSIAGLSATEVRDRLGRDFTQDMPQRITDKLGIDVWVLDLEGDAYTLQSDDHTIIIVKATAIWGRQNFSLAHELGHIATQSFPSRPGECKAADEAQANTFAADLLMPQSRLRAFDWEGSSVQAVANEVWELGVSTKALQVRLEALRIKVGASIAEALELNTFSLLRHHWHKRDNIPDLIDLRRSRSALRKTPSQLISRLEKLAQEGQVPVESLAFALGVPATEIELDTTLQNSLERDLAFLREHLP